MAQTPDPFAALQRRIDKLIRDYGLARIELEVRPRGALARAIPEPYSRAVQQAREAAILAKGGSVTLAEATAINERVTDEPVAKGSGVQLAAALDALAEQLRFARQGGRL